MKKKTIKINFKYFWGGFDPEDNFFTNLLRKLYIVEISDNPDYMFYSVYPEIKPGKNISKKGEFIKKISPKLYILLRKAYPKVLLLIKREKRYPELKGSFIKIFFGPEYIKPDMSKCDWAFSTYLEEEIKSDRYMRIPLTLVNDFRLNNLGIPPVKKHINFQKIKMEKERFCNFIYSQEILSRNNFFKILSKYKDIDSPGRCMNNMSPIGEKSPIKSRNSKNWIEEKLKFIKKYKFTIAFENSISPGGVTEKLTHPMLVNSIPIYIGDKFVNREFNTKSFINYNDFRNMKEFINFIIKVDNDDKLYKKILKESWYKNNNLPRDWDINRIKQRLKQIFD